MRQRWRVVLVDEFQDTDPVQWQVLDRAFSGHATMVLIGDPKQAIYAFRGGDVVTYLAAARTATRRATLATNRRSDAALSTALTRAAPGRRRSATRIIRPAGHRGPAGLPARRGAAAGPFRLRVVDRASLGAPGDEGLPIERAAGLRRRRPRRATSPRLLASGATFDGRPLQPRDVAVLVRRTSEAVRGRGGARRRGHRHGSRRTGQRLRHAGRTATGWPCSRRWSSRTARPWSGRRP